MANNIWDITNKVGKFIESNRLIGNASKVYVATSGGADSMALLSYLYENRYSLDIEVAAVHVNHGIRGETARRDASFVRDFCESHDIEFKLFDAEADGVEVPENASEEWARQLRYGYLSALENKSTKIATAHTLSDQAETIIFRMARGGSGLQGMSGIPVSRGSFIRPFLCITRNEVEQLVEFYGTGNITDETNLGDDYSRNKIRHNIVPVMKQINTSFENSIGKLCDRMDKAQKFIAKQAKMALASAEVIPGHKYKADAFFNADDIILDEMLLQLLSVFGIQSEQNITSIENRINTLKSNECTGNDIELIDLNNGFRVYITKGYITLVDSKKEKEKKCELGDNSVSEFGYDISIEEVSVDEYIKDTADKFRLCLYASESNLNLSEAIIRTKHTGDKFKPAKKVGGTVTKFMRTIPYAERDEVPMIEYNGAIIWLWGMGFTDGLIPTESDLDSGKKIYRITWK